MVYLLTFTERNTTDVVAVPFAGDDGGNLKRGFMGASQACMGRCGGGGGVNNKLVCFV